MVMETVGHEEDVDRYAKPQRWAINFSNGLEYVNTIAALHRGELRIYDTPAPKFSPERFEWEQMESGESTPTVRFYIHSLKWLDQLIADGLSKSATADASARLARDVAESWWIEASKGTWDDDEYVWGGHGFALRATTLTGLSELFPREGWLRSSIETHGAKLVSDFDGYWNHGLVQSLALMCVAGRLGDDEALEIGSERARSCLDVMVDEEGCINEQAPEYARYIERLLRVVIRVFRHNEIAGAEALNEKKQKIRNFIAHALRPDFTFAELGDSAPRSPSLIKDSPIEFVMTNGAVGAPIDRIGVYKGGFVFGRSGFGRERPLKDETFYTLRFGPQRIIHGHNDHTSMTFWGSNREVIVDPGHVGYTPGKERNYVRSHAAHNVMTVNGEKHDWSADTDLAKWRRGDAWQTYKFSDEGYARFPRKRSVMFTDCGPFAVLDRVTNVGDPTTRYFSQRWNVSPEFEFEGSNSEAVFFRSSRDGTRFTLVRYRLESPLQIHGQTALDLAYGDHERMLGLVARGDELVPAWNVGFGHSGEQLTLFTVGFLSPAGSDDGWSFRIDGSGDPVFRVHIGPKSWAFALDLDEGEVQPKSIPVAPSI